MLVVVSLLAVDTVTAQQDRVVPPIYVPPEPDRGTPGGHGTFEGRGYHVMRYRQHYGVTFHPGLPQNQPTVVRAMAMLCQTVAKFDVRGVVPHTTSPPSDDTWVFKREPAFAWGQCSDPPIRTRPSSRFGGYPFAPLRCHRHREMSRTERTIREPHVAIGK